MSALSRDPEELDGYFLNDVYVEEECLFLPETEVDLDVVETGGFLWFELLVTASYLGAASRLVEKVYELGRYTADERVRLLIEMETSAAALRGIAYEMEGYESSQRIDEAILAKMLLVRYGVQQHISRITYHAAEILGGLPS